MTHRLSLDVGTNSLGWCLIKLDKNKQPQGIEALGARIYTDGRDPQSKESLAKTRRIARSMRRRRDRYLRRRRKLMRALVRSGLMPKSRKERKALEERDPYELRAKALKQKLHPHEIGRALFHLNQRRGFKSNRKSEGDEKESGLIRRGINALKADMKRAKARTLGEFLFLRRKNGKPVRARMVTATIKGKDGKERTIDIYPFYPERWMAEEEFDLIWKTQKKYHPKLLTVKAEEKIKDIIFFQRRLRPVKAGRCLFHENEERLPWAHPLAQRKRVFETVNSLRICIPGEKSRSLTKEERDKVAAKLLAGIDQSFETLRNSVLKLPPDATFNLESAVRKKLRGDDLAARMKKKGLFGKGWFDLSIDDQIAVVEKLDDPKLEDERVVQWLIDYFGLDKNRAEAISHASLSWGHSGLGLTATRAILKELEGDVISYSEACKKAGYHHSDFRDGEIFDQLPYYGEVLARHVVPGQGKDDSDEERFGRIANPTVHIGLNQIHRLVNLLIERYGHPGQIVVELARDLKLNEKQKKRVLATQKENRERNDRCSKLLQELGLPENAENRLRYRLWEELDPKNIANRACVYTGKTISKRALFSNEVEIEHILPYSRTLDNSPANKTVSYRAANREKKHKSPYETWGNNPKRWEAILSRAQNLPPNKRWRFAVDAMKRFEEKVEFPDPETGEVVEIPSFLARQLNETRYLARITREYLSKVSPNVWVVPGQLTALVRRHLGLEEVLSTHNVKNRNDHRHHAVDAVAIAVIDRSLLNRAAREAARAEGRGEVAEKVIRRIPDPWEGFRNEVQEKVNKIIVSHRQDHSKKGKLHADTAYGIVSGPVKGVCEVVHRVPFETLTTKKDIEQIRDPLIREKLLTLTKGKEKEAFKEAVRDYCLNPRKYERKYPIRTLRVCEPLSVIPIRNEQGKIYKSYPGSSNYRIDIWDLPNGKWEGEVISTFEANSGNEYRSAVKEKHPTARKIMRLHKNDLIAIENRGERQIMRVVKFRQSKQIALAGHTEAGDLKKRDADGNDPFKYLYCQPSTLRKFKARKVKIDETGRLFDPGPRD